MYKNKKIKKRLHAVMVTAELLTELIFWTYIYIYKYIYKGELHMARHTIN